jgi:hypothetical protein
MACDGFERRSATQYRAIILIGWNRALKGAAKIRQSLCD